MTVSPISDGLVLNLDASKLNLDDGDSVTSWLDQSGNSNNADDGPGATYKSSAFNGMGAVEFDGVDDYLQIPDSDVNLRFLRGSSSWTCFYVLRYTGDAGAQMVLAASHSTDYDNPFSAFLRDSGEWVDRFGDRAVDEETTMLAQGEQSIITSRWVRGEKLEHYLNGSIEGDYSQSDEPDEQDLEAEVSVGRSTAGVDLPFEGEIAEILVYDRALDDGERSKLESYLHAKWFDQDLDPYFEEVLKDKPIHYWRLNETSSDTVKDEIGDSDGSVEGDVELDVDGRINSAEDAAP